MLYNKIRNIHIDQLIEIFNHDILKYADGTSPEETWLTEIINHGYARGLFDGDCLKVALVAEPLLMGGVYLWLMATKVEDINKGYGTILYSEFEKEMKELGKSWIFATACSKPEKFWIKQGFITQNLLVKELCKNIK